LRGERKIIELSRCGTAFGAHQDVSGLGMSSFVQEASARSLSFRCQGVVLRLAPSRCLRPAHVELRSRGERKILEHSRVWYCLWRPSRWPRPAHVELRSRGKRKIIVLQMPRRGAAFGAHQDVSGLRMSSFVREASARSLSFRCQGVVLRLARIKMSPACACRTSFESRAQDH